MMLSAAESKIDWIREALSSNCCSIRRFSVMSRAVTYTRPLSGVKTAVQDSNREEPSKHRIRDSNLSDSNA